MQRPRRDVLRLAVGAAALPAVSRVVWAQSYPSRPVRVIVPFPPGGQIDIVARLMAQWLSERLGQQFVVDNRAGAGGNVGTEAALRAPADGYTLLLASATNAVNATLFGKLGFDFVRDSAAVAAINHIPLVLAAHPSFPVRTVADLIADAKAHPGKLSLAMPTKGTGPYMAAQLFTMMSGINVVHVPYRGDGPMLTDLLGAQVLVAFGGLSPALEHIRSGKLRALALAGATRIEALPDVPTIGETVAGYAASGWSGVVAPKGTRVAVVDSLNAAINTALADPTFGARLANVGVTVFATSPAQFARHIVDETEKWGRVVRFAGLKPD